MDAELNNSLLHSYSSSQKPEPLVDRVLVSDLSILFPDSLTIQVTPVTNYYQYYEILQKYWSLAPIAPYYLHHGMYPRPIFGSHPRQIVWPNQPSATRASLIFTAAWPSTTLADMLLELSLSQIITIIAQLIKMYDILNCHDLPIVHGSLTASKIGLVPFKDNDGQQHYWPLILAWSGARVGTFGIQGAKARSYSQLEDFYVLINDLLQRTENRINAYHVFTSLLPALSFFFPDQNQHQLSRSFKNTNQDGSFDSQQRRIYQHRTINELLSTWQRQFAIDYFNWPTITNNKLQPIWESDRSILDTDFGRLYLANRKR